MLLDFGLLRRSTSSIRGLVDFGLLRRSTSSIVVDSSTLASCVVLPRPSVDSSTLASCVVLPRPSVDSSTLASCVVLPRPSVDSSTLASCVVLPRPSVDSSTLASCVVLGSGFLLRSRVPFRTHFYLSHPWGRTACIRAGVHGLQFRHPWRSRCAIVQDPS